MTTTEENPMRTTTRPLPHRLAQPIPVPGPSPITRAVRALGRFLTPIAGALVVGVALLVITTPYAEQLAALPLSARAVVVVALAALLVLALDGARMLLRRTRRAVRRR